MRRVGETVRCEGAPLGVGGRDRRWGRAAARQPVPRGPRPEGSESEEGTPEDAALKGGWCFEKKPFVSVRTDGCYALAGSVEYEMAQCEPSDSTAVCGEVMRALCEGPEGEPRWAADVRLGDSVRIVRKTAQAPQPPGE